MTDIVYTGWIAASEGDRETLESMGIIVGPWNPEARCFDDCQLDAEAFRALQRMRHMYVYGLSRLNSGWRGPYFEPVG